MYASIDIGTNSILLLIGEPNDDGSVQILADRADITRLGEKVEKTGKLSDEAINRTLETLGGLWELCHRHKVQRIACVGTEVLRRAQNAADFAFVVKRTYNIDIDIITPEREAQLTFLGATRDFGEDNIVCDIGGGSTEITHRDDAGELKSVSLPIGCVTLTERFLKSDPPKDKQCLAAIEEIQKRVTDITPNGRRMIVTAGTATTLMAMHLGLEKYDAARVHGQTLTEEMLADLFGQLRAVSLRHRKKIVGLDPKRADVIIAGAIILDELMDRLGKDEVTVSDRGVKWGLFYEAFCKTAP